MKWTKYLILVSLSLILLIVLAGCGGGNQTQKNETANKEAAYLQIKGSDTEVNLVQHLAESFMKNSDAKMSVTGGGSGTGIASLINKKVDIANASRTMKDSEIKQAKDNNVNPVRVVIAMDGLSVITNENNPIDALTVNLLGKIFKGEITNWQEIGGPDLTISLYGRQSNSGTFVYFRDHVLKGDYSAEMKRMNGNAQIVESIKNDKAGIGYVGVGYVVDEEGNEVDGINILNVARDNESPSVSPLKAENVKNGTYPLARPLNQYTDGKPKGAVLDFIKFELSDEGQKIAVEEGFYPVSPQYQDLNKENAGL